MYDCDRDLKWKIFKDVWYFCAMTTPGGDRNELDARFVSQCATLFINRPTDAIAFTIYRSILRGHLADFSPILHPISDTLIKMTLRLFQVKLFEFFFFFLFTVCEMCSVHERVPLAMISTHRSRLSLSTFCLYRFCRR